MYLSIQWCKTINYKSTINHLVAESNRFQILHEYWCVQENTSTNGDKCVLAAVCVRWMSFSPLNYNNSKSDSKLFAQKTLFVPLMSCLSPGVHIYILQSTLWGDVCDKEELKDERTDESHCSCFVLRRELVRVSPVLLWLPALQDPSGDSFLTLSDLLLWLWVSQMSAKSNNAICVQQSGA